MTYTGLIYLPLEISCNFNALRDKIELYLNTSNRVSWEERNARQIALYKEFCNLNFKEIVIPIEFSHCTNRLCKDIEHKRTKDKLYRNIIGILSDAARHSYVELSSKKTKTCRRMK